MITTNAEDKRVLMQIANLNFSMREGVRVGWKEVGSRLVLELRKQTLEKPKAGRLYRIGGRLHRASKAGETPAARTGAGGRNYTRQTSFESNASQLIFGNRAIYAKWLEDGTRKMAARNGLKNAIDAQQNELPSIMQKEIDRQIKK